MNKQVYIAGCFDNYLEIRNIQHILEDHGYEITYDWTVRAEKTILDRQKENESPVRTPHQLKEEAVLDMNGVIVADWTLFIMTEKNYVYRSTFCELGASITRDIMHDKIGHTIILSNDQEDTYAQTLCFYHHPNIIHVKTIKEALDMMKQT